MRFSTIALVVMTVVGCGGSKGASSDANYDGTWKASISGGTLTFAVRGDQVLGGEFRYPMPSGFPMIEYLAIPDPIKDSAFVVTPQNPSDSSEWSGSFASSTSASGMVTISTFDETESQFAFETVSWTAEKVSETPMVGLGLVLQGSKGVLSSVSVVPASTEFSCREGMCSGFFPAGSEVTIVPQPCSECTFQGWSETAHCVGAESCTLTLDQYTFVRATFE